MTVAIFHHSESTCHVLRLRAGTSSQALSSRRKEGDGVALEVRSAAEDRLSAVGLFFTVKHQPLLVVFSEDTSPARAPPSQQLSVCRSAAIADLTC